MKKIYLSFTLLLVFNYCTKAQTIKTPRNVSLSVVLQDEFSAPQLAAVEAEAAQWIDDNHSNAVRVAPASNTYNCHAWAWHVKDGGNHVWLNAHSDLDDDPEILKVYWSGSYPTYTQTTTISESTVAFYGSCWQNINNKWVNWCDHSAQVISSSQFESKWGAWPRYRHTPTDCPYNSSNIQYYKVPITGDNSVCISSSKSFNTHNISGASFSWSGSKISISGSTYSVTAHGTSLGSGYIAVNISSPYSGTTVYAKKNLSIYDVPTITGQTVDGSAYSPYSAAYLCPGNHWLGISFSGYNPSYAIWTVPPGVPYFAGENQLDFTLYSSATNFDITAKSQNTCGYSSNAVYHIAKKTYGCSGLLSINIFPNPSNDIITVETKFIEDNDSIQSDLIAEEILLINNHGKILVYEFPKESSTTFSINNIPDGEYYIHIKISGEVIKKHIEIRR